jgi:starch synthase (maltosyl-transferring)
VEPVPGRASADAPARILIEHPTPVVDCGRYRPKRTLGETFEVGADIFRDGHEVLRAVVRWKAPGPGKRPWQEAPLRHVDAASKGVRWEGGFPVDALGRWKWTVEAWVDELASWRDEIRRKADAGQDDLDSELTEGALLLRATAKRAKGDDRTAIAAAADVVEDATSPTRTRVGVALDPALGARCDAHPDRSRSTRLATAQELDVDPERARFGSWYELFPRSWGGLKGVEAQLPALADLGFDVLYLPPIHPIGVTNRKGPNNTLVAGPDDPGSPWAVGGVEGGHTAVHPDLGTIDDLDDLVVAARALGIEIALDFAIQCSADHPWLTEHPEWFNRRPDGTLKYAENPPKKYQDIYNVNFDCEDWRGLWEALRDVVVFWVDHGVHVFRVDNPHTKPVPFWEWLIRSAKEEHPEVIFLAEAFTHRAMMRTLAKAGFDQSYTYFTWKYSSWELAEYVDELANDEDREYFRPNFFVNTPDILTAELADGGPAKFASRLILAATLSPSYGIYSGFESFESTPVQPGSEEYLDSEKYEAKRRALDGPLLPLVEQLNRIRRQQVPLQHLAGTRFLDTENPAILAFAKQHDGHTVITAVSLDPDHVQEGVVVVPYELGLPPSFKAHDLLTGDTWDWRIGRNYVRLVPLEQPAHIIEIEVA